MYADHTDGNDLSRLADDGCPHASTGETTTHDAVEVGAPVCKNDQLRG